MGNLKRASRLSVVAAVAAALAFGATRANAETDDAAKAELQAKRARRAELDRRLKALRAAKELIDTHGAGEAAADKPAGEKPAEAKPVAEKEAPAPAKGESAKPVDPAAKSEAEAASAVSADDAKFFGETIRPILEANCFSCHGAKPKVKGGLNLTTRAGLLKGGDLGPAINLEKPGESLLLAMISYKDEDHQMPPAGKLPQEAIDALAEWIKRGAPWPGEAAEAAPAEKPAPALAELFEKAKSHWSYQKVARPEPPQAEDAAWNANPVDQFIHAKLREKGLKPAPPASPRSLIRRATYDLTGLPPTPEEVEAFAADESPEAYPKLVERLLASPHYGERWGRHWLDVARYAETNGYERDNPKPNIWRYRDYVINAFNSDKPYDRFVVEQLAGDELPGAGPEQVIATGIYRLAVWDDEPADKAQGRYDTLDDILSATTQGFLGMTMGCARCHEHKIDHYPHADYYRFLAFFQNVTEMHTTDIVKSILPPEEQIGHDLAAKKKQAEMSALTLQTGPLLEEFQKAWHEANAKAEAPVEQPSDWDAAIREKGELLLGGEKFKRYMALRERREALNKKQIPGEWAAAVFEKGAEAPETHILLRGNPNVPGEKVEPGFPSMLPGGAPEIAPPPGGKSTGRRTALAKWIASAENPLTARVMANRIWQHHFGRGIVRTPNDFGLGGAAPTHPELLDWLASEFVAQGWSVKAMHRLLMNSMAYRMASGGNAEAFEKDPGNDWFGRFNMRRLEAEEVRDSILAAAGKLNLAMGGPSVYPKLPKEVLATSSQPLNAWKKSTEEEQNRRSVYAHVKRSLLMPILADFDLADTDSSCPQRFSTVLPTQALNMLNSEFIHEEAESLAARLRREAGESAEAQVRRALELVMQRPPKPEEIAQGGKFIAEMAAEEKLPPEKALERFCLLALNLNEFVFLD